jgi:hypothetical protein
VSGCLWPSCKGCCESTWWTWSRATAWATNMQNATAVVSMLATSLYVDGGQRQLTEQERRDAPTGLLHRERRYCTNRVGDTVRDIILWRFLGIDSFRRRAATLLLSGQCHMFCSIVIDTLHLTKPGARVSRLEVAPRHLSLSICCAYITIRIRHQRSRPWIGYQMR